MPIQPLMKATLTDYSGQRIDELEVASWECLQRVVAFYHTQLLHTLNTPYPPASTPGNPPHKRTGWLQKNVLYVLDKAKGLGKVGVTVNASYGAYLEFGTRKMAARPWLVATLKRWLPQLRVLALQTRAKGNN